MAHWSAESNAANSSSSGLTNAKNDLYPAIPKTAEASKRVQRPTTEGDTAYNPT